ncbi:Uncharacterised protein [[Clostridium] sordellii]|uniref:Uncharacterized protein n=1 Tax=bioreactor metagenome TaxID=1076179 RepID=A0A644VKH2_9ZZZZ|nr:hypothetical protein [Paeniclostridium sordellii]CEQ26583.1 Uncharacterised protein [[Clostridium] sordellii] [Paeniclostridium sordellii]
MITKIKINGIDLIEIKSYIPFELREKIKVLGEEYIITSISSDCNVIEIDCENASKYDEWK